MIEETAQVVTIESGRILVEVQRQSVCGSCAANKGCGSAVLQKVLGQRRTQISIPYQQQKLHVGDKVVLGLSERALVKGSMLVYALPILLMMGFGLVGELVGQQLSVISVDVMSILFSVVGLALGLFWLKYYFWQVGTLHLYQPKILKIIGH